MTNSTQTQYRHIFLPETTMCFLFLEPKMKVKKETFQINLVFKQDFIILRHLSIWCLKLPDEI